MDETPFNDELQSDSMNDKIQPTKESKVVETNKKILHSEDSDEGDDDIPSLSDHEEPPSTPDPNLETEDNTNETSENVPKIFNTENDTVNPYLNNISKNEKLVQSEEANHMEHMEVENEVTKESDENVFLNAIKENTAQHSTFSPDMNLDAEENVSQTFNIEKIEITPDIMSGSEHDKSIQKIENDEIFPKEESDMLDTKLGDLKNVENERKRSFDIDSASNTPEKKKKCSEWKGYKYPCKNCGESF